MSEAQYEFIKGIASILNIEEAKILRKGVELITLLNLKPQLNCSATCKGVICLDIASSFYSNPIKKEDAIKYSGCKKKNYINMFNNISKLLNLDKVYTIKEICLLMNVCDIKETAVKLFEKFKNHCDKVHYDFEHPMYGCAAVWAVCRKNKIKINHSKLVEISRIKKSELDNLTKKFEELTEAQKSKEHLKRQMEKQKKTSEDYSGVKIMETFKKRKPSSSIMSDEEYLEWKKRMLE